MSNEKSETATCPDLVSSRGAFDVREVPVATPPNDPPEDPRLKDSELGDSALCDVEIVSLSPESAVASALVSNADISAALAEIDDRAPNKRSEIFHFINKNYCNFEVYALCQI
jgi:hypothetical protein